MDYGNLTPQQIKVLAEFAQDIHTWGITHPARGNLYPGHHGGQGASPEEWKDYVRTRNDNLRYAAAEALREAGITPLARTVDW